MCGPLSYIQFLSRCCFCYFAFWNHCVAVIVIGIGIVNVIILLIVADVDVNRKGFDLVIRDYVEPWYYKLYDRDDDALYGMEWTITLDFTPSRSRALSLSLVALSHSCWQLQRFAIPLTSLYGSHLWQACHDQDHLLGDDGQPPGSAFEYWFLDLLDQRCNGNLDHPFADAEAIIVRF